MYGVTSRPALVLLMSAYAGSTLLANLTLNTFIPLPFYGMLSVGTIFFAFIFTLRDRIHMHGNVKFVLWAIALALLVNTLAAWLLDTPLRFIMASFIAILCGELSDTAIFHRLRRRAWGWRVLSSNAVSVPVDSMLFTLLAFHGVLSYAEMAQIIYADIVVKYVVSALLIVRWHWYQHYSTQV